MEVSIRHSFAHKYFNWHRFKFSVRKKTVWFKLNLATDFNQLTAKQLIRLIGSNRGLKFLRYLQISNLFNLLEPNDLAHKLRLKNILGPEQVHALLPYADFLLEKAQLTKNLFPKIKGYYGPDNCLFNLTADEYAHTYMYLRQYQETKDEQYLNKLIAVLYRPGKWFLFVKKHLPGYDGDPRLAFNPTFTNKYEEKIAKWPWAYKQAVLIFYSSCEDYIAQQHPFVFNNSGHSTESANWGKVIIYVAGPRFGTVEHTGKTFIYTILEFLNTQAKEALNNKK